MRNPPSLIIGEYPWPKIHLLAPPRSAAVSWEKLCGLHITKPSLVVTPTGQKAVLSLWGRKRTTGSPLTISKVDYELSKETNDRRFCGTG